MRFLVQRVSEANVMVDNNITGKIGKGYLVLIGITHTDTTDDADYLINKLLNLRVFCDENDKMNLNINQVNGELLLVSQFTLYANTSHGNRPDFLEAAKPAYAEELYEYIIKECTFISAPKIPVPTSIPLSLNLLLNSSYNKVALSPPRALIYDGLLPLEASPYKVN